MNSTRYFLCMSFLIIAFIMNGKANDSIPYSFFAGPRFQKSIGFYWMNGITLEYSSEKILKRKLSFAFSYVSSRLGSAFASEALPLFQTEFSVIKYFRQEKYFKPQLILNTGYARADFGSDIFNDIPDQAPLLSIEAGARYDFHFPLCIVAGAGFNLLTGNGTRGLGTIYPVFTQCSILYKLRK